MFIKDKVSVSEIVARSARRLRYFCGFESALSSLGNLGRGLRATDDGRWQEGRPVLESRPVTHVPLGWL